MPQVDARPFTIRAYEPRDRAQILALYDKQSEVWFGKKTPENVLDPDDPLVAVACVVEVDGRVCAAVGAKRTVEMVMTLDPEGLPLKELMRTLVKAWAWNIVALGKQGYEDASARVGPHIRRWANTLVKRGFFVREKYDVFRFDLKKACASVQKP